MAYIFRKDGILTEYDQSVAAVAVSEFIDRLPARRADLEQAVHDFVVGLYRRISPDHSKYFLDKTPRYYLIWEFLSRVYPDAKFLFLFRNPLEILSSIINTWGGGRLHRIHKHWIDLTVGIEAVSQASVALADRATIIHYSDLVRSPRRTLESIFSFLGLDPPEEFQIQLSSADLEGTVGDRTGKSPGLEPIQRTNAKRTPALDGVVRKYIAGKIVKGMSDLSLRQHNVSIAELQEQISCLPPKANRTLTDVIDLLSSHIVSKGRLNLFLSASTKHRIDGRWMD